MDRTTLVWIVVGAAVLVLLVVLALALRGRRGRVHDERREEAARLRQEADSERLELQRREAEAARVDAEARMAQAEADARAAEAARLQADAQEHAARVDSHRTEVEERLRRADEIDPDVRADRRRDVVDDGPRGVDPDALPER